jgi:hypothetical protein
MNPPILLPSGLRRPGRETFHSSPTNADFKNEWSYISTVYAWNVFMLYCLIKHGDSFNLSFLSGFSVVEIDVFNHLT